MAALVKTEIRSVTMIINDCILVDVYQNYLDIVVVVSLWLMLQATDQKVVCSSPDHQQAVALRLFSMDPTLLCFKKVV